MPAPPHPRPVPRIHVAHVEADDFGEAEAGTEREGDDRVVADVSDRRAKNQALLVGRQRSGGEVRHPHRFPR